MAAVTTAKPDAAPASSAEPEPTPPWVLGGVAAELATRLRASATFIRLLLVLASVALSWRVIVAYAAAALMLPHSGARRPGWRNVVGAGRFGLLFGITTFGFPALAFDKTGLFGEGPAVWLPFAGAILAGFVALLASGRQHALLVEPEARRLVMSWLPAAALALTIAVGMFLVPTVRWELVLDAGIAALALTLVGGESRGRVPTSAIPVVLLAFVAILLAFSGVRLQGGVGHLWAVPRNLALVRPTYRRAIGSEVIDLRGLRGGPGRVVAFVASVGIGNVTVGLPANSIGTVDVRVGAGRLSALELRPGPATSGFVLHRVLAISPWPPAPPGPARERVQVRVVAEVGRGCVTIVQSYNESFGSC